LHYCKTLNNNVIYDRLLRDRCRSPKGDAQGIVRVQTQQIRPHLSIYDSVEFEIMQHPQATQDTNRNALLPYELYHSKAIWTLFIILELVLTLDFITMHVANTATSISANLLPHKNVASEDRF